MMQGHFGTAVKNGMFLIMNHTPRERRHNSLKRKHLSIFSLTNHKEELSGGSMRIICLSHKLFREKKEEKPIFKNLSKEINRQLNNGEAQIPTNNMKIKVPPQ